jgi:KDO2-lipid IV(A) lauroyltransferase
MLSALMRVWACLPLGTVRYFGAIAGRATWWLSPSYRGKALANLRRAGYRDPTLAIRAAAQAGRMVAESPWIWFRPSWASVDRVCCEPADLEMVAAAERAGRGILFLTPHLGTFEITPRWYGRRAPITVLYKPPRRPVLAPVMAVAREAPGVRAVPATLGGVRVLLRALRRGEAVGLLPDQVPTDGEGAWAPFFGELAWTMTLPQRLVQATGATVLLAVGERLPGAQGWRLWFDRFEAPATPEAVNAAMERLVHRLPEQYLWGYNRYKRPPGVPMPVGVRVTAEPIVEHRR